MRKAVTNTEYRQINTNETDFLIQNLSKYVVHLIITPTVAQPTNGEQFDFILDYKQGISSKDVTGFVWAKADNPNAVLGLIEG